MGVLRERGEKWYVAARGGRRTEDENVEGGVEGKACDGAPVRDARTKGEN